MPQANEGTMPIIRGANFLWVLMSVLALVVGLIAGRMGLVGQPPNTLSLANFRADFPLRKIQTKTFSNETVQIDGNEFIDCTFDNVIFKFDGTAPFRFSNDHFQGHSKYSLTSNNPVIKSTIELMGAFINLTNPPQPPTKENK
jgi:hypothetical protein